ncbi:MAG: GNAT family N-acetyltransferase [Alphaproteobacteria bacterium]|nr:GNAT family N-acetyltransferase [Alphaproteobacteria bacterium]
MTATVPYRVEVVTNPTAVAGVLAKLHVSCFAGSPQDTWSDCAISTLLNTPGTIGLIALGSKEEAIGFIIGRAVADEGEVLTLCVSPASRRHGVATALVGQLREYLFSHHQIFLEVAITNWAARDLYQSLGFQEVGRQTAYYRRGGKSVDALVMASGRSDGPGRLLKKHMN